MESKIYLVGGKELELYPIGALSKKLDRQPQTIRKWERDGIIPPAQYRTKTNRRLYTKAQIQAIADVVERFGLKQGLAFPENFKEEIYKAFNEVS